MTHATTALVLRSIAVLIAVVAVIDPVSSSNVVPPRQLVVVRSAAMDTAGVAQSLVAALPGWTIVTRDAGVRIPCGPDERCVVVADGSMNPEWPADVVTPISLVPVRAEGAPNVSVRSAAAAPAHVLASSTVRVELSGRGMIGKRSGVRVMDGAAIVGSMIHEWTAEHALRDLPWIPIEAGARHLRIDVDALEGETTAIDNAIDVGVAVADQRARVLVLDARPSWSSTFVRRALEDDPRFAVDYRARIAPALSAGTARGRLDPGSLDEAAVVVIGGPDALTAGDVTLLEQFVKARGGTLVLLPERRDFGEAARLTDGAWTEHLMSSPEAVGPLHASEILRLARLPIASTVLGRSGSSPAIVVLPTGQGRIVMSGAMDAWRYRDRDAGAFDRFWQSIVQEGAVAGAGLQLRFDQPLVGRGSQARFTIRDRRMRPVSRVEAAAVMRCGSGPARTVRLWPAGGLGEFVGELPASHSGSCDIEATVDGRRVTASIAVADRPMRGVDETLASLSRRVEAGGGTVAPDGEVDRLVRTLASSEAPMSLDVTTHPMRDWWWMVPFSACLSLEWWLRRRDGLR